jgi:translation initiation factor 1
MAITSNEAVKKVGKVSAATTNALKTLGLGATEKLAKPLPLLTTDDLEKAAWIVALNQVEHLPLLQERFPAWAEKIEFWEIDDSPESLVRIEREVMDLASRLLRGGQRRKPPTENLCPRCRQPVSTCTCQMEQQVPRNVTIRVGRETKGRRGKGVTIISDLPLDESRLVELATKLKQQLGTGGTTKDGRIEIQGDHRDRIVQELEGRGYRVKRAGG